MEASTTKTERILEASMAQHAGDAERVDALARTKTFKRSWIQLAGALVQIRERETWKRWGFEDFDDYYSKELHLRRSTVDKLCASYGFLRANAPRLVRDDSPTVPVNEPIPSWEAVQYVAKAEERGAADENVLTEMKRAAFEEGASVPALSRRFREVAFPVDDEEKRQRLRAQIVAAARRLADLVAEPDAGVPRALSERAEIVAGEIVQALEDASQAA
jgi:hypothetical protein